MKLRVLPAAVVLIGAAGLSGCVSLLPKSEPAQLYRFGYRGQPATCGRPAPVGVIVTPPEFPRESGSDQLLTVSGDQVAYIAGSRWVSPARNMFEDAVDEAFRTSCAVRLVRRVDAGAGSVRMRLDMDRFEAVYPAGTPEAGKAAETAPPPVVTVSLKATLMQRGGDFGAETFLTASQPATENRVGAIAAAYSVAVTKVLGDLTAWTDGQAVKVAAEEDGPHPALARPAPPLATTTTTSTTTSSSATQTPR